MTILHKGIRRDVTDVLNDYGMAHYVQNVRYRVQGEVGRRPGIGQSNLAKLDGPVVLLAGSIFDEPYIVQIQDDGTVTTTRDPQLKWGDPRFPPPPPPPIPPCTLFDPMSDIGTTNGTATFILPEFCCASVVTVTAIEDAGRRGDAYGYIFTVDIDGLPFGVTGCLVDDSQMFNIPAEAAIVSVTVTGECAGGTDPGIWQVQIAQ